MEGKKEKEEEEQRQQQKKKKKKKEKEQKQQKQQQQQQKKKKEEEGEEEGFDDVFAFEEKAWDLVLQNSQKPLGCLMKAFAGLLCFVVAFCGYKRNPLTSETRNPFPGRWGFGKIWWQSLEEEEEEFSTLACVGWGLGFWKTNSLRIQEIETMSWKKNNGWEWWASKP